jgi:tetratricopeptide (TPR) repeat protein
MVLYPRSSVNSISRGDSGLKASDRDIHALITNMEKLSNGDQIVRHLQQIANLGYKKARRYSKAADYENAAEQYTLVAKAYKKVIDMIKEHPRKYSSIQKLIETYRETANYWEKQAEFSLSEGSKDKLLNYKIKGKDLQNLGNYTGSIKSFDTAIESSDSYKQIDLLIEQGNTYYYNEEYVKAKDNYSKASSIDPSNPIAQGNLGLARMAQRDYPGAIEAFQRAIELDKTADTYFLEMGVAHYKLRQYPEAMTFVEGALKLNPNSSRAWNTLGSIYNDGGLSSEQAKACFKRAIEIDPDYDIAKANLAEILLILEEYEESEKWAKVVRNNGDERYGFIVRFLLICSYYMREQEERAIKGVYDLLSYMDSFDSNYEIDWNFDSLWKQVNEKVQNANSKRVLSSVLSLKEHSNRETKAQKISEIRRLMPVNAKLFEQAAIKLAEQISVENKSEADDTPGYYRWEIYLRADESTLSQIDKVIYYLHPTFLNHIREVDAISDEIRRDGFRLKERGWGEFQVKVKVIFKGNRKITKYHWLKLSGTTPLDTA